MMTNDDVCRGAIDKYGKEHQIIVAIEELSELQKELTKTLRGIENRDHISEEMADVRIMFRQLILLYDNQEEIWEWERKKLNRLWERMGNG